MSVSSSSPCREPASRLRSPSASAAKLAAEELAAEAAAVAPRVRAVRESADRASAPSRLRADAFGAATPRAPGRGNFVPSAVEELLFVKSCIVEAVRVLLRSVVDMIVNRWCRGRYGVKRQ